jgi:hypothetical protein
MMARSEGSLQPQSPRREKPSISRQNPYMPEKRPESTEGYLSLSFLSCDWGVAVDLAAGAWRCLGNDTWFLFAFRTTISNFCCVCDGSELAAEAQAVDRRIAASAASMEKERMAIHLLCRSVAQPGETRMDNQVIVHAGDSHIGFRIAAKNYTKVHSN